MIDFERSEDRQRSAATSRLCLDPVLTSATTTTSRLALAPVMYGLGGRPILILLFKPTLPLPLGLGKYSLDPPHQLAFQFGGKFKSVTLSAVRLSPPGRTY